MIRTFFKTTFAIFRPRHLTHFNPQVSFLPILAHKNLLPLLLHFPPPPLLSKTYWSRSLLNIKQQNLIHHQKGSISRKLWKNCHHPLQKVHQYSSPCNPIFPSYAHIFSRYLPLSFEKLVQNQRILAWLLCESYWEGRSCLDKGFSVLEPQERYYWQENGW